MFYGKIHYKWPFSIAMLNYQRVFKKTPLNMGHFYGTLIFNGIYISIFLWYQKLSEY